MLLGCTGCWSFAQCPSELCSPFGLGSPKQTGDFLSARAGGGFFFGPNHQSEWNPHPSFPSPVTPLLPAGRGEGGNGQIMVDE